MANDITRTTVGTAALRIADRVPATEALGLLLLMMALIIDTITCDWIVLSLL
jgi:hypothetical protein